jgi:hypothetical protein
MVASFINMVNQLGEILDLPYLDHLCCTCCSWISVAIAGTIRACSVIFNPYGLEGIDTD